VPHTDDPQQQDAPAGRRRLAKTALTPSLDDLILALAEAMKTSLKVMLNETIGDHESDVEYL